MKNKKAKTKAFGKTLNLITLLVAISKCLAEKISIEKSINPENAEKFIIECISEGMKTITSKE